jgi:tetratricopeptide (TPR) repeat protein
MHDADDEMDESDEKTIWEWIKERSGAERADALYQLGTRLFGSDRFAEAAAALAAAADLYVAEDRHIPAGKCLHNAAVTLSIEGRQTDALAAHERAVVEFRKGWAHADAGDCEAHVAIMLRATGQFRAAETRLDGARRELIADGRPVPAASFALTRAEWSIAAGRFAEAVRLLRDARAVLRRDNATRAVAGADERLADAYLHLGRIEEALASARSARAVYEALGDGDGVAAIDSRRAEIMAAAGEPHEALALLEQVRTREREAGRAPNVAWCDVRAGRILMGLDDPDAAGPLLEAAVAVFEAAGVDQWAAVARIDWASALLAAGEGGDRAGRVVRRAQTPLRRAGMTWEARRCRRVQAAARQDAALPVRKIVRRHEAVA